jgi:hypothetical protein
MRAQFAARLKAPMFPLHDAMWFVAERETRVLAAAAVKRLEARTLYVADFVRDERRFMSAPALAALGEFLVTWATHEGLVLECKVPRHNEAYEEILKSTGLVHEVEAAADWTRYRSVSPN